MSVLRRRRRAAPGQRRRRVERPGRGPPRPPGHPPGPDRHGLRPTRHRPGDHLPRPLRPAHADHPRRRRADPGAALILVRRARLVAVEPLKKIGAGHRAGRQRRAGGPGSPDAPAGGVPPLHRRRRRHALPPRSTDASRGSRRPTSGRGRVGVPADRGAANGRRCGDHRKARRLARTPGRGTAWLTEPGWTR